MILQGKEVRPDKAKKIGLVDLVVDPFALESTAIDHARQLADGSLKAKTKKKDWMRWFLEDTPPGRYARYTRYTRYTSPKCHVIIRFCVISCGFM